MAWLVKLYLYLNFILFAENPIVVLNIFFIYDFFLACVPQFFTISLADSGTKENFGEVSFRYS